MFRKFAGRYVKELIKQPFYVAYEHRLQSTAHTWEKPKHIGIIMDGNRRFARRSGLDKVVDGHALGAEKLREVLNWSYEFDIPVVTVWSFSLDNFQREPSEVEGLLGLFEAKTWELVQNEDVHRNQVKVRYIGKVDRLPESLQEAISAAEDATAHYERHALNIAIAYGGREEITDAFASYLSDEARMGHTVEQALERLNSGRIDTYLYTSGLPEPELIIRTSGEVRMSGFLLWQSAYSEYYFCDTYWPAFRKIDFLRALRAYDQRQRRFGR